MQCVFCLRLVKNKNSKAQHELRCKLNPKRIVVKPSFGMLGKKGTNQWIKGTAKPVTDETKRKISNASRNQIWSDERRKKHSDSMKRAVEKFPESYTSSNRGRTKQIIHDNIKFQGKWELEFYEYCKIKNIQIIRSNESFEYEWDGKRKYFPDFYIPGLDVYVEIKGYETDKDRAKWKHFPRKLLVIRKHDILEMRKDTFDLTSKEPYTLTC